MASSETTAKKGFFHRHVETATEVVSPATKVYVYEAPVRIWHWVTAICIVLLCVTGYFIGQPPGSVTGEASYHFFFGWIRLIHFGAGLTLAVFMVLRIYWFLVGNHHAKELFLPPVWSKKWWGEVWHEIRWYTFTTDRPKKYIGHNPLAQIAMFTLFLLPCLVIILTGLALYAEGQGIDSWWYSAFGWVITMFGNSFVVHTIHRVCMWIIICFSTIHIYLAIREDIMSRQSLVSTMISGWRYFKDDRE